MFKVKNLLFCASILFFSTISCNEAVDQCDNKELAKNYDDNQDEGFDFIDELIEAPKNPNAKPSSFRIPDVVREYGMRTLEFMFYLRNSAGSNYQAFIKRLKKIYYNRL